MAQYTLDSLKDLWVKAGGNPQYASQAAQLAYTRSGGNSSASGGLWGIDTTSTDVLSSARKAVTASGNGAGFLTDTTDPFQFGAVTAGEITPGDPIGNWVSDLLGVDLAWTVIRYAAIALAGWVLMFAGLSLMFFSSRTIKNVLGAAVSTVGGGVGFGLGANVTTRETGRSSQTGLPSGRGRKGPGGEGGGGDGAPLPPSPPPTGPIPSAGSISPAPRARRALFETMEMPPVTPVSEGGTVRGPIRRQRIKQPISERGGLFRNPRVSEGGRHRADT